MNTLICVHHWILKNKTRIWSGPGVEALLPTSWVRHDPDFPLQWPQWRWNLSRTQWEGKRACLKKMPPSTDCCVQLSYLLTRLPLSHVRLNHCWWTLSSLRQSFSYKYATQTTTLKILCVPSSQWLAGQTGGRRDRLRCLWTPPRHRPTHSNVHTLWCSFKFDSTGEPQLGAAGRFTVMSDPGPPAAWRPALSSAGLGPGGDPPALSSGLKKNQNQKQTQLHAAVKQCNAV